MLNIKFLPAFNGDCILITTNKFNILIDGGTQKTYSLSLKKALKEVNQLDLVILTHIDSDHIMGLIELFKYNKTVVKKVWFNSLSELSQLFDGRYNKQIEYSTNDKRKDISPKQGESLEDILRKSNIEYELIYIEKQQKYIFQDLEIILLSPYKENLKALYLYWKDNIKKRKDLESEGLSSQTNQSSIAFILIYKKEKKYLFLADANINIISNSIKKLYPNRLKVEFVKVSHHGSKNNTNQKFLDVIDSDKFIILTNGQAKNYHPDKEALNTIILDAKQRNKKVDILFNYPKKTYRKTYFQSKELEGDSSFTLIFPKDINSRLVYTDIKGFENG